MTDNNQSPQTVDLNAINTTQQTPVQEGFFDKQLKNFAGFVAKMTGQPDPQTWAVQTPVQNSASLPQEQSFISSQSPMTAESQVQNTTPPQQENLQATQLPKSPKAPSFFDKLVANTQNLLNKTQQVANNLIEQGKEIWAGVVATTQNLAEQAKTTTANIVQNPVETIKNTASQAVSTVQNTGEKVFQSGNQAGQNIKEQATISGSEGGFLQQVNQGLWTIVEKTKEIWSSAVANTKSFVQNPLEHIDNLAGAGVPQSPVQTETENTTSLENLEKDAPRTSPTTSV